MIDSVVEILHYAEKENIDISNIIVHGNFGKFSRIFDVYGIHHTSLDVKPLDSIEIVPAQYTRKDYTAFIRRSECLFPSPKTYGKSQLLFVIRRGRRKLINENDCIAAIKNTFSEYYDIVVCDFGIMTFEEQFESMNNCKIMVAVHGAGITNCVFMRSNTALLEIFPETFRYDVYKYLCSQKKIKYASIHGKDSVTPTMGLTDKKTPEETRKARDVDLSISVDELINKINQLIHDI
jgi:hypothetical protein